MIIGKSVCVQTTGVIDVVTSSQCYAVGEANHVA